MAEEFLQTITAPQVLPLVAQAPDRFNSGVAHLESLNELLQNKAWVLLS